MANNAVILRFSGNHTAQDLLINQQKVIAPLAARPECALCIVLLQPIANPSAFGSFMRQTYAAFGSRLVGLRLSPKRTQDVACLMQGIEVCTGMLDFAVKLSEDPDDLLHLTQSDETAFLAAFHALPPQILRVAVKQVFCLSILRTIAKRCPDLQALYLHAGQLDQDMDNSTMSHMTGFPGLTVLHLNGFDLGHMDAAVFVRLFPLLVELDLRNCISHARSMCNLLTHLPGMGLTKLGMHGLSVCMHCGSENMEDVLPGMARDLAALPLIELDARLHFDHCQIIRASYCHEESTRWLAMLSRELQNNITLVSVETDWPIEDIVTLVQRNQALTSLGIGLK